VLSRKSVIARLQAITDRREAELRNSPVLMPAIAIQSDGDPAREGNPYVAAVLLAVSAGGVIDVSASVPLALTIHLRKFS